jgi:hypothetical protein
MLQFYVTTHVNFTVYFYDLIIRKSSDFFDALAFFPLTVDSLDDVFLNSLELKVVELERTKRKCAA